MQFEDSLYILPTFKNRFTRLRFRIFPTYNSFRIDGDSSHGSNSPRYPFTLIIATDALFRLMQRNRNYHIDSLKETGLYQFHSHVSSHDGSYLFLPPIFKQM